MTILTIKDVSTDNSANFSCSLYKLRLKFVQTTRVVCTDFGEVLTLGNAITISHMLTLTLVQGKRIKIIKYIDWEDVDEPCKGDTPA